MWCAVLVTVTIRAAGARRRAGRSSAVSAQWPRWLVPNCISKPSAVRRSGMPITPALLTRRSSVSWAARMRSAAARTEAWFERSSSTTSSDASGWVASMSATAAATFSWLRAAITTWAPAAASARAVSRPSPPLAPVTTAVRPSCEGMSATVHAIMRLLTECSFSQEFYHVTEAEVAPADDVRPQAAPVDQRAQRARRQALEVRAGLAQALAEALHAADAERPADEGVEVDAARRHVAARVLGREAERLEVLDPDERDVVAAAVGVGERPAPLV